MAPCTYRLLVLDIDGTLVTSRKHLLPEVRLAVRAARAAGLEVSFATGRMFGAVAGWVRELGLRTPQICNNGADIVDPVSGAWLQRLSLDPALAVAVLEFGRQVPVTMAVFSGDRVWAHAKAPDHWLIERNNEPVTVVPWPELLERAAHCEKLLFLDGAHPERLPARRDALAARFTRDGRTPFALEITEPGILNICHPEASKGRALVTLCRHLDLSPAAVAAVGDSDNDTELLAAAGLGIAMGNATAGSKAAVRITVEDNDQAGVVTAICDHVLAGCSLPAEAQRARQLRRLRLAVREHGSALIAFSGGVDSTLLLAVAAAELGDQLLAVTARSAVFPPADFAGACDLAARFGVRHEILDTDAANQAWYATNPPDRCYVCKLAFFTRLRALARERGLAAVLDGENADDLRADRPGRRAAEECGVRRPLAETGLSKAEVRALSRELGLPTWDKPANACLATRFPRGERLTPERLRAVAVAESALAERGLGQLRVRVHGDLARLEVAPDALAGVLRERVAIVAILRGQGFRHVTLDLEGYQTGSMD